MMNEVGIPIDRIWTHLQALPRKNPALPEIVHASLGDFGGLWGGLARLRLARERISLAPAGSIGQASV